MGEVEAVGLSSAGLDGWVGGWDVPFECDAWGGREDEGGGLDVHVEERGVAWMWVGWVGGWVDAMRWMNRN